MTIHAVLSRSELITDVKEFIDACIKTGETGRRKFGSKWNWIDAAYMKEGVGGGLFNEEDGMGHEQWITKRFGKNKIEFYLA
jgi:hypothetical protein